MFPLSPEALRPPLAPPGGHPERSEEPAFLSPRSLDPRKPTTCHSRFLLAVGCKLSTVGLLFGLSSIQFELSAFSRPLLSPFSTTLTKSAHQHDFTCFSSPLFSYAYALFCTVQNHTCFIFMGLRTLCAKHPGGGALRSEERR